MKRTGSLSTFWLVVFGLFSASTYAQPAALPSDGQTDYEGRLVVFVSVAKSPVTACSTQMYLYNAVIFSPAGGSTLVKEIAFSDPMADAGDRFVITSQSDCGGGDLWLTLQEKSPGPFAITQGDVDRTVGVQEGNSLVTVDVAGDFETVSGMYSVVDALVIGSGQPKMITVGIYEYAGTPIQLGDRFDVWLSDSVDLILVKN